MQKRLCALGTLLVATSLSFAQGKPTTAKKDQAKEQRLSASAPTPAPSKATGPTGLGSIKLGMTKEAIEAIQPEESVHLNGVLGAYVNKYYLPKPGEDKFEGTLVTPFDTSGRKAVMTFSSGLLTSIEVLLDDSSNMLERVKAQIAEKYGEGQVEDKRKEEQCIYKNGANFKLTSGTIATNWVQKVSAAESVETRVSHTSIEICPSNLRYGSTGPIKADSLLIRTISNTPEEKPKNVF